MLSMIRVLLQLILSLFLATSGQFVLAQQTVSSIEFREHKILSRTGDSVMCYTANLTVPENRLSVQTNRIQLSILKLKAKKQNRRNPIIFLAGGPGQSGINYIKEEYFQKLVFNLQEDHDIILLDQRGSGSSQPSLLYQFPHAPVTDIFVSAEPIIRLANEASKAGADSMRKKGIDIKGYNTIQSADDVNDLRKALGAEKINLLAISYGTHLALVIARKYPTAVENMVLIGTSGLNDMHHLPVVYDKQLKKISDEAAADSAVRSKVPDMIDLLKKILAKLERQPVEISIHDNKADSIIHIKIGKFGLQFLLRLDAGDSYDFVYFPALLYGIEKGDYSLLEEYAEKRYNQLNANYGSGIGVIRSASGATRQRYREIASKVKRAC